MNNLFGLPEEFNMSEKRPSTEALGRWRNAVTLVRNRRRRFRYAANLDKRLEAEEHKEKLKERIRVGFVAYIAALRFIDAQMEGYEKGQSEDTEEEPEEEPEEDTEADLIKDLPEESRAAGFKIHPDRLASIVSTYDITTLRKLNGVEGLAKRLNVSLEDGVKSNDIPVRENVYGTNKYPEKPVRSFWMFVWEALQDLTLMILMFCAVVSIGVGLATEGWPKGMYDGLGIMLSIFLVVIVTAVSDYKQSLQFKDLEKEKKKISMQVTRDGVRQKVSIYDLVVGDVVHLFIGDLIPAEGIFISGYNLLIDESSLTGESVPVNINEKRPFLLGGSTVQDGSAKMLITTVGMKTEWGKLMETLAEGGEDETPLQVKLNGVATLIGKIGLAFAVLTFLVLTVRFLVEKGIQHELTKWSSNDALTLLDYFAIAVTIIVVAVTLSLAFAMKKLMEALVRHLSAFETMEVFNEINSRDMEKINIFRGMFTSRIFVAVMVATIVFQVIIVEFLGTFASTVPLNWQLWLLSILIGAVSMIIAVVLKCIPVNRTETAKHHDGHDLLPSGSASTPIDHDAIFLQAGINKGRIYGMGSQGSVGPAHTVPRSRCHITKTEIQAAVARETKTLHHLVTEQNAEMRKLREDQAKEMRKLREDNNEQLRQLQEQIMLLVQRFPAPPKQQPPRGDRT